jgi:hypothetical protein
MLPELCVSSSVCFSFTFVLYSAEVVNPVIGCLVDVSVLYVVISWRTVVGVIVDLIPV